MRAITITTISALALAAVLLTGAWLGLRPPGPTLMSASLSHTAISPNADGDDDVTRIEYELRRPATISIYMEDAQGQRFYFRRERPREAGTHTVDFSGVVEGYQLPDETIAGQIVDRVLRDGQYRWVIEAVDGAGQVERAEGSLAVQGADTSLPQLNMSVMPPVFSPNQDGIGDRADINVWLEKDIAPDGLRVYLVGPNGSQLPIAEKTTNIPFGQRGIHAYDYDAGIDLGVEPPPDGLYTVRAVAEDALGQRVMAEQTLTIDLGGLPRADILRAEVDWSATSVVVGNTLYFTLTVENYGTAPIRTSGPDAGFVYDSMATNANTLGEYEESGAWRVGIHCQTCKSDYPWRWALGSQEELTMIPDDSGQPQYYLMPGQLATVSGGIVLDEVIPSRNPQYFWAGLIHEDVAIAEVNNRVSAALVTIVQP